MRSCWRRIISAPARIAPLASSGLGATSKALAAYEAVLAIDPGALDVLNECGGLHARLGSPAAAVGFYERALAIAPGTVELLINKGTALAALNRFDEALESFTAAMAIDPERAEAHYNAGLVRLRLGDFAAGWREFEWRWRKPDWVGMRREFAAPLWLGDKSLAGKTILLLAEQGLGDTVQFLRYAPLVAALGAKVILGVQTPLKAIAATVPGVSLVVGDGEGCRRLIFIVRCSACRWPSDRTCDGTGQHSLFTAMSGAPRQVAAKGCRRTDAFASDCAGPAAARI